MNSSPGKVRKRRERPGEVAVKRSQASQQQLRESEEIEEFIQTVDDDVLENKYSSSFEGSIEDYTEQ